MGPVFYLVQCDGVRDLISAVLLGNWPHEFALALLLGKRAGGGCIPWPAAFSAGFFRGRAAKKAQFLDPVQPLNARNNDGQWQALRQVLCLHRKEEEEKEAGLRAPHREADAAGAKAKERARAPRLRHLPGCISLARGAGGRAARAAQEMRHRLSKGSKTQRREGLGSKSSNADTPSEAAIAGAGYQGRRCIFLLICSFALALAHCL